MTKQSKDPKATKEDSAVKAGELKVESGTQTTVGKTTAQSGKKTRTSTKLERELKVYPAKYSMHKIAYDGGGEIPKILKGLFTSYEIAKNHLDRYLAKKK